MAITRLAESHSQSSRTSISAQVAHSDEGPVLRRIRKHESAKSFDAAIMAIF